MKVLTVYVELETIKAMEALVGTHKLFPSRSELIRHAIIDHLKNKITELEEMKQLRERERINRSVNKVRVMNDDGSYTTLNIKQQGDEK